MARQDTPIALQTGNKKVATNTTDPQPNPNPQLSTLSSPILSLILSHLVTQPPVAPRHSAAKRTLQARLQPIQHPTSPTQEPHILEAPSPPLGWVIGEEMYRFVDFPGFGQKKKGGKKIPRLPWQGRIIQGYVTIEMHNNLTTRTAA